MDTAALSLDAAQLRKLAQFDNLKAEVAYLGGGLLEKKVSKQEGKPEKKEKPKEPKEATGRDDAPFCRDPKPKPTPKQGKQEKVQEGKPEKPSSPAAVPPQQKEKEKEKKKPQKKAKKAPQAELKAAEEEESDEEEVHDEGDDEEGTDDGDGSDEQPAAAERTRHAPPAQAKKKAQPSEDVPPFWVGLPVWGVLLLAVGALYTGLRVARRPQALPEVDVSYARPRKPAGKVARGGASRRR
eukprot:gene40966-65620_t